MLKPQLVERKFGFMASTEDYAAAQVVLLGIPLEATLSFQPGTRFAPAQIRSLSEGLEEYSFDLGKELNNVSFYDAGDLSLPIGNLSESLRRAENAAAQLVQEGKKPLFIGGEHLVSFPLIKALSRHYPNLVVLHMDAHADLRDNYLGQNLSHATVMRRVSEIIPGKRIYQFGIRSGTREEFAFAQTHTHFYPSQVFTPLQSVLSQLTAVPIYLTLDIDVVDPGFAPGTGTPEPGGITPQEILQSLHCLQGLNVVAMDLVEVSPPNDPQNITGLLGAKIIREALLSFWA